MIIKSHFTGIRWFIKSSQRSFLIVRMVLFAYVNHYNASEQWCPRFQHYAYLMARKIMFYFPLVLAQSRAATIQLKCDISYLNEISDRQVEFLSFLNCYYLIAGYTFNEHTTNFIALKRHIRRKISDKIKHSSRINWRTTSEQVSHFWVFQLRITIGWQNYIS